MLYKVTSNIKRNEIIKILENEHARHKQRLWMTGFLKYAGYSADDVCKIIQSSAQWLDYDEGYTKFQVYFLFNNKKTYPYQSSRVQSTQGIDDVVLDFLKNTTPFKLEVPKNIIDAVACYYREGFTPLPKSKTEKRPAFEWREFQHRKPSLSEVVEWDWSYGICLLANEQYSFLDIDVSGYETVFTGRHVEKTPRGGLHVFGKGKMRSMNIEGAEIKGQGTLIITAPTSGYEVIYK